MIALYGRDGEITQWVSKQVDVRAHDVVVCSVEETVSSRAGSSNLTILQYTDAFLAPIPPVHLRKG